LKDGRQIQGRLGCASVVNCSALVVEAVSHGWANIARGATASPDCVGRARHFAYSAGWKKFEPLWDALIRARQVSHALPVLESVLSGLGRVKTRPSNPGNPTVDIVPRKNVSIAEQPIRLLPSKALRT
jgi:hypothetical protein